jgi:hypothetical protein
MPRPKRDPTPDEREVILRMRPGHSLEEVRGVLAERFPPAPSLGLLWRWTNEMKPELGRAMAERMTGR